MKHLVPISLLAILIPVTTHAQTIPQELPEWFYCNEDSDCTLTYDECGNFIGANTANLTKSEAFFKELGPKVNCVSPSRTFEKSDYSVACQHTKESCVIKKWFGLIEEIDHASTCVSQHKKCIAQIQKEQAGH